MVNVTCNVLEPQKITLPLKNAAGQVLPAYSPGVAFTPEFAPGPNVKYDWRFLERGENPAASGIIVTMLTPGQLTVYLTASVGQQGQNSVRDSATLNAAGNANFQQPQIVVTDSVP